MAEIKEYRLGGAGGYSLHAVGSKTRSGTTYESIFVRRDHREWPIRERADLCNLLRYFHTDDAKHLTSLYDEARKHLAIGSV